MLPSSTRSPGAPIVQRYAGNPYVDDAKQGNVRISLCSGNARTGAAVLNLSSGARTSPTYCRPNEICSLDTCEAPPVLELWRGNVAGSVVRVVRALQSSVALHLSRPEKYDSAKLTTTARKMGARLLYKILNLASAAQGVEREYPL
jgi:hypothetical protein